ncbi:zinc finger HIT domain-containing protein 3 [Falco biarmicus]|uniref:zinc finger HIT domain-containing protein 3 n=1 Tax=Falco rusticolus TaxID=120794 RepID=UPI001886A4BA|nr:zinc finger HIT domain-containing protein 3 [Falco rusticolus]XP_055576080.1 zinc finger HIT domain-containing protein 3 [Falco cherrug]XP_055654115.1 zinc finger HIT domain-containing protein 3 [Falco peregrinus]XP_056192468.1 zinc finger HIT domain-containing protein 3 [Falco biarmicus]
MRAPRPCTVCGAAGAAKYRCPRCAAAYCSVPCCRNHKERCRPEPKRERPAAGQAFPGGPSRAEQRAGSPWSVEDILAEDDEQDRVPLHKLKLLGESEELRGLLLNPHLRQLLLTVDQAEDKSSLMKKYMQEPIFVEFADCCLRIVEPSEKENILPE